MASTSTKSSDRPTHASVKRQGIPHPVGNFEFIHRVQAGDTISGIAATYRKLGWNVPSWEPIWKMNDSVYKNLRHRGDPNKIYPGDVVVIPRSPDGYDNAIKRLRALQTEMKKTRIERHKGLGSIAKSATSFEEGVNAIGTALTFVATLTLKGVKLVGAGVKVAAASGPALEKAVYERSFLAFEFYSEAILGGGEVIATGAGSAGGAKGFKTTKAVVNTVVGGKKAISEFGEAAKMAAKFKIVGEALANGIVTAAGFIKYTDPGTLARKLSGLDDELKRQNMIADSICDHVNRELSQKIRVLQQQKVIVY